jgi:two-component system sensor histidine kinase BarA
MTAPSVPPTPTLDSLTLGVGITLDQLVDRGALGELAESYYELFGVPVRVFGQDGTILADVSRAEELYRYLEQSDRVRPALQQVVSTVKSIDPGLDGEVSHACITGAMYRVVGVSYDSRPLGRVILGPFLPSQVREVPASLLSLDPDLDLERLRALLGKMPRAREETVSQIARHLKRALDLILFSGHKALLTSNMHLASVRESFRELKEKNAKLQETYDRLKELDRLKSNFLATVSHELRTPLTSIIGYSEMLVEGIAGNLTGEQREFISTIHGKSGQLLELIKGLLDLSKLESGTMSLRKDSVDIEMVIDDVCETIAPAALKNGVQLTVRVESGLPLLWGDAGRLRQVLLNLAENAIKFTPQGGDVQISATATFLEVAQQELTEAHALFNPRRVAVQIRVADTGVGIAEHERLRVFDAFYQVDSSSTREQGGTGLGLSIVKRLVEAHGGTVHVEGNSPQGAVFVVTVPCRRATIV